jgi:transcriptional regulator of acetoin/glycerol metabolism
MEQQRTIRLAWENFLKSGVPPHGLPKALAASWTRSRTFGVGVQCNMAPLAGEPEIFRRRSNNAELLNASRPALERSGIFLAEASSMLVLADTTGFIIETAGDPRVIDDGRRNHLETGGQWEEGVIGTNAIGTVLADLSPVQIHGAEHFCEDVQRWTCAAAPVCHPIDGGLLGVVDISGHAASFNPQSLALAMAVAREIEATFGEISRMEHETLFRHFVSKRSVWLNEDILVIDRRGFIVHQTEKIHRRQDTYDMGGFVQDIRKTVGAAGGALWEEVCKRRFPNASIEIVRSGSTVLGCLIVLHHSRSRSVLAGTKFPPVRQVVPERVVGFDEIIGESEAICKARQRARQLADSHIPVLIEGETGVGKELFARAIKNASPSRDGPFVPVNCGGFARDLIASELFGYAKGAFTGADENGRGGKIEQANGGLLCLDEIGEMPFDLQSYLLRVIEDGMVYRIGEHEGRLAEFQILSMTNRDLLAEVEAGRFRRDLYYRLAAARLWVPPLREREDDILMLAERFAAAAATRRQRRTPRFTEGTLAALRAYRWPGNIRELRNVIETMITLSSSHEYLTEDNLPPEILSIRAVSAPSAEGEFKDVHNPSLEDVKRSVILARLDECGGNLAETARRLGISRSTLYARLAKLRAES